jgi:hypothetical protein
MIASGICNMNAAYPFLDDLDPLLLLLLELELPERDDRPLDERDRLVDPEDRLLEDRERLTEPEERLLLEEDDEPDRRRTLPRDREVPLERPDEEEPRRRTVVRPFEEDGVEDLLVTERDWPPPLSSLLRRTTVPVLVVPSAAESSDPLRTRATTVLPFPRFPPPPDPPVDPVPPTALLLVPPTVPPTR